MKFSSISHISIDSRDSIDKNTLFVAINAKKDDPTRFDGHDYIDDVYNKNCRFFVVESADWFKDKYCDAIFIVVEDCIYAYGKIANLYKKMFNIPFVAITGSCGKTTVKDLTHFFLSLEYKTLKTHGNLNNEIGVPKTIFTLEADDEIAVLEAAMNHAGELSRISSIIEPNCVVINNVEHVHTEFFENGIDGIAQAKSEIFECSKKGSVLIVNKDTNCLDIVLEKAKSNKNIEHIVAFSIDEAFNITESSFVYMGILFKHNLIGTFNVSNIIAALKVAEYYGVNLETCAKFLKNFVPAKNRMEIMTISNATVINDTYNSNPKALSEMLKYLDSRDEAIKIAVIGDMFELGDESEYYHKQIAVTINLLKINHVYTIGKQTRCIYDNLTDKEKYHFDDISVLSKHLKKQLVQDSVVLIKASHGCRLDNLLKML